DQVMERIADTDVWTVETNATNSINLTHELVVTASDRAGNTNTSVIGLTVLLRGDVVRDGNLNSADVLYIAKYLVGKESRPSLLVSDMSPDIGDERVTSADALYLAKYLVGKEAAP
ncbi:MAG: dockerin type I domain-containing protein, partial [Methanosarcinaceae archaeon]